MPRRAQIDNSYINIPIRDYQNNLRIEFNRIFPDPNSDSEWSSFQNSTEFYCPRPDLAVGPFAMQEGLNYEYNILLNGKEEFIGDLLNCHNTNLEAYGYSNNDYVTYGSIVSANSNPRCLFAVEIENKTSMKHRLGGMVNASALGKIALSVGTSSDSIRKHIRIWAYLKFLSDVSKNIFNCSNLLILSPIQLSNCLKIAIAKSQTTT